MDSVPLACEDESDQAPGVSVSFINLSYFYCLCMVFGFSFSVFFMRMFFFLWKSFPTYFQFLFCCIVVITFCFCSCLFCDCVLFSSFSVILRLLSNIFVCDNAVVFDGKLSMLLISILWILHSSHVLLSLSDSLSGLLDKLALSWGVRQAVVIMILV